MNGGDISPMYDSRGNISGWSIAPCVEGGVVCVEGPLPSCVASGPAWLVTMGGRNRLMTVCMTMLGPPIGLLVTVCGVNMGPLAMAMPENGFGLEPAMGIDGVVWRSGSDWYGSKYESEVVWPSNGVGDR